jgi:hypothetical protein
MKTSNKKQKEKQFEPPRHQGTKKSRNLDWFQNSSNFLPFAVLGALVSWW